LNCTSINLDAKYDRSGKDNFTDSQIYANLYVDASKSPTNSFLQVLADNPGVIDVGKILSFSIKTTESLPSITYQVLSMSRLFSNKLNFMSQLL
jgi:hypothetical protein